MDEKRYLEWYKKFKKLKTSQYIQLSEVTLFIGYTEMIENKKELEHDYIFGRSIYNISEDEYYKYTEGMQKIADDIQEEMEARLNITTDPEPNDRNLPDFMIAKPFDTWRLDYKDELSRWDDKCLLKLLEFCSNNINDYKNYSAQSYYNMQYKKKSNSLQAPTSTLPPAELVRMYMETHLLCEGNRKYYNRRIKECKKTNAKRGIALNKDSIKEVDKIEQDWIEEYTKITKSLFKKDPRTESELLQFFKQKGIHIDDAKTTINNLLLIQEKLRQKQAKYNKHK